MKQLLLLALLSLLSSACSYSPVKPWEKDVLAKPSMALTPHVVDSFLDEHIYFSKEASTGGQGVGGGGCGCN